MSNNMILNIPHSSTWITGVRCIPAVHIAAAYGAVMKMVHEELLPMTDWYTDDLFINGIGIPIVAPVSRIICDTERFKDDELEPMSKIGMGVCYTRTHDLKYSFPWKNSQRDYMISNYYDVHHKNLEHAVGRSLYEHGSALILDCHSFSPIPLPYEPDQNPDRPEICIGTDSFHTPDRLSEITQRFFLDKGYSVKINSPYAGSIVPIKYLHKNVKVRSIMIELNRGLYLKEGTKEKNERFDTLKQHIKEYEEWLSEFR